jgi:hypothetical protein
VANVSDKFNFFPKPSKFLSNQISNTRHIFKPKVPVKSSYLSTTIILPWKLPFGGATQNNTAT